MKLVTLTAIALTAAGAGVALAQGNTTAKGGEVYKNNPPNSQTSTGNNDTSVNSGGGGGNAPAEVTGKNPPRGGNQTGDVSNKTPQEAVNEGSRAGGSGN
jgi:hypothetical protein